MQKSKYYEIIIYNFMSANLKIQTFQNPKSKNIETNKQMEFQNIYITIKDLNQY